jgi:hypothetical protein
MRSNLYKVGGPQLYLCQSIVTALYEANNSNFFFMARQPYMGLGLLVSSRFHDHTL